MTRIISICFKTPDAVEAGIEDYLNSRDDLDRHEIEEFLSRWIKYNEYIVVDFDLDTKVATVLEK